MKLISLNVPENFEHIGEVFLKDFSILGFKKSIDEKSIDIYYLCIDIDNNVLLFKSSYLINQDDKDNEMSFINHPLNSQFNISTYDDTKKQLVENAMSKCDKSNSFYSNFSAIDIFDNNTVLCRGIQIELDKSFKVKNVIIPMSIYMKLASIRHSFIFKFPINPFIDKDTRYDKLKLNFIDKIDYLGTYVMEKENIMNFYSMKLPNKAIGVWMPIVGEKDKLIKKPFDIYKFKSLYSDDFMIDLSRVMVLDWIVDNKPKQLLCLVRSSVNPINGEQFMEFYISYENLNESFILNPYKELYS